MKIKDYDRIAEVMKIIKKKIIPDIIKIDDYNKSVELHLIFNKEEEADLQEKKWK